MDDRPKGYLDKYSIRESVSDGTTVPLHYQLAPNDLLVDRETLEKEFLDLAEAEGISDLDELNRVLDKAVTLKNMLKNQERVEKVARFVAEHFKSTVEPMGYKAFLVGVDREACALYKDALDKHLPPEYSEVVMSSMGKKDTERLQRFQLSELQEQAIRKKFRNPDEQPKILIVTEKLLTGFDAPILYCMYLDKPMRDHVLLQAIARVNRPYEDQDGRRKTCGFVLDFVGIFDKLEKALAFDSQDVEAVVEGIDVLKEHFENLMHQGRENYLTIAADKKGDKAVEAILEHFRDRERREDFYAYFRELEELHEILSPDKFLRPFLTDYGRLTEMYQIVRGAYDRSVSVDKSFLRKTAQLVRENTKSSEIGQPTKLQKLDSGTLQAIADSDQPDTVKVFNLLRALDQLVAQQANQEPYLISIGEKAEHIAELFETRQKTTEETLEELQRITQEYDKAVAERRATELTAESFAVYWLLKQDEVDKAMDVAPATFVTRTHMCSTSDSADWNAILTKRPKNHSSGFLVYRLSGLIASPCTRRTPSSMIDLLFVHSILNCFSLDPLDGSPDSSPISLTGLPEGHFQVSDRGVNHRRLIIGRQVRKPLCENVLSAHE